MKGLILAAAALALLVVGSVAALRVYAGNKEFKVFLGAFAAAAVALYTGAFWLLPADLGFIPVAAGEPAPLRRLRETDCCCWSCCSTATGASRTSPA